MLAKKQLQALMLAPDSCRHLWRWYERARTPPATPARAPVGRQVVQQDALRHAGLHGRRARRRADLDREAGRHADVVARVKDPVPHAPCEYKARASTCTRRWGRKRMSCSAALQRCACVACDAGSEHTRAPWCKQGGRPEGKRHAHRVAVPVYEATLCAACRAEGKSAHLHNLAVSVPALPDCKSVQATPLAFCLAYSAESGSIHRHSMRKILPLSFNTSFTQTEGSFWTCCMISPSCHCIGAGWRTGPEYHVAPS